MINTMKMLTRFTGIVSILITLGACSSTIYQASWQAKPVVADGNPTEWSLPLRYSDSESGLQYNVTNDETNLYICIRAIEQPIQMKILSSGMELWLDPSGKNKETAGIQFPLPGMHGPKPMAENRQQERNPGKNSGKMNMAELFQLQEPQLTLSGFRPEYNGTFMVSKAKGMKAAINWDEQNNMTYELIVPLLSFNTKANSTLKNNPVIGFKINVNALAAMGSGPQAGGMHGGPPGGAGEGPGGGGMQGGNRGGPGGGHEMGEMHQPPYGSPSGELSSATSIKFKVKLNGLVNK